MKRRIFINLAVFSLIVLTTLGGNALLSLTEHPAFTHNDYVFGQRMVIDNKTPFEYDAALAVSDGSGGVGLISFDDPIATWEQVRDEYGNKILREKDGRLYTVYSAGGNRLQYVFFKRDAYGNWNLYTEGLYDTVHSTNGYIWENDVYEWDLPVAILGEAKPTHSIDAQHALRYARIAEKTLYSIRHNTDTPDIRQILADGVASQAYRMTIEGIFHGVYIFDFYVYRDGTGTLHYRRYCAESIAVEYIFDDISYSLTVAETDALLSVFKEQAFFDLPPVHPYEATNIMDGYLIYLEGASYLHTFSSGSHDFPDYHMIQIHDHSILYPELTAIYDAMMDTVRSHGTEVRINTCVEEETLRQTALP